MKRYGKFGRRLLYFIIFTSLLVLLFSGFVIAEKNTRKIEFGNEIPLFEFLRLNDGRHYVKFKFMDLEYNMDFTDYYNFSQNVAESTVNCVNIFKYYLTFD